MENFERKTSPKNGIDTENWFIESYRRYKGHPIRILIALYKGNYHKFVMAVICFFIKHACVWVCFHQKHQSKTRSQKKCCCAAAFKESLR